MEKEQPEAYYMPPSCLAEAVLWMGKYGCQLNRVAGVD